MLRLLLVALALAVSAAHAQPVPEILPLGPLAVEAGGTALPLQPVAAAADGGGFVVVAVVTGDDVGDERERPWVLRLDADGAVAEARPLASQAGRVQRVFEPRFAPTMRPDGDGWLVGGVFRGEAGGLSLRAVRIAPDLTSRVNVERRLGGDANVDLFDVLRLSDELVLFSGGALVQGGLRTVPVALAVSPDGAERALLPAAELHEEITTAAVLGRHLVLGGWTRAADERTTVVRVFDEQLRQVGARTFTSPGFPEGPRVVAIGEGRAFLAAALPDSTARGTERLLAAVLDAPGAEIAGTVWAAERTEVDYTLDAVGALPGTGLVMLARAPVGGARARAVVVRHAEGGDAGWTAPVGGVAERDGNVRVLAVGGTDALPLALSARRDDADVWHLELARLRAAP